MSKNVVFRNQSLINASTTGKLAVAAKKPTFLEGNGFYSQSLMKYLTAVLNLNKLSMPHFNWLIIFDCHTFPFALIYFYQSTWKFITWIVALPQWGTTITLSNFNRGWSSGKGSGSVTSRAAALKYLFFNASTKSSVLTTPPKYMTTDDINKSVLQECFQQPTYLLAEKRFMR